MSTMAEKMETHDFKAEPAGSSDASTGSGAVDEANMDVGGEWTVAEEKTIRRKFDRTITPLVTLLCESDLVRETIVACHSY
jgi:hypothetical protein